MHARGAVATSTESRYDSMTSRLHLPSLSVEGFRGIRSLELPKLGRVTLLAGGNGIGKTTVLDAIRSYVSRGEFRVLVELLANREEFVAGYDEDGDAVLYPDFASLFHDYNPDDGESSPTAIRIHASRSSPSLSLRLVDAEKDTRPPSLLPLEPPPKDLLVSVGKHSRRHATDPMRFSHRTGRYLRQYRSRSVTDSWFPPIQFESLGPGLLANDDISRLWDAVALTEAENLTIQALRLVVGETLERLAVIGDSSGSYSRGGRRVVAKLTSSSVPVPLKRLGDGANRLLTIALALANCRNGILLVDEVENGIHYSIQPALWRMVFGAAEAGNVQVVAATHSWDCIVGFATAAAETPVDGTMFRLERFEDNLHAIHYSEEKLVVAARQRTEVR